MTLQGRQQLISLISILTQWMSIFILETNHRNPSRHRIEEHDMLNWLKANRKLLNASKLMEPRLNKFNELLALIEQHKHQPVEIEV